MSLPYASGAAFITLDSEDDQEIMLLTNPKGGANFYLRDKNSLTQMTVVAGETYGDTQFPDGGTRSLQPESFLSR